MTDYATTIASALSTRHPYEALRGYVRGLLAGRLRCAEVRAALARHTPTNGHAARALARVSSEVDEFCAGAEPTTGSE